MVTACGQRFKIISFVSFTGPKSEAYCWRGMLVNLQPVVSYYVRSRTQHSYAFLIFIMFASKLSINGKTARLKTWFSCGRTRSFHHFLASDLSYSPIQNLSFGKKSAINSRGQWSAHRGCQSNRQPQTSLPAEQRTPLCFLTSCQSFSVSFLGFSRCFCNRFE